MSVQPLSPQSWKRYGAAIGLVALAAALRIWPLQALGSGVPWLTFYPVVMIAAIYGGFYAGLLATFLACIVVSLFWSSIVPIPLVLNYAHWLGTAIFVLSGCLVSAVAETMHRAQERAMNALKQSEIANQSRVLFDNSPTGMVAIDPNSGRIVQANSVELQMLGYDADEILTKTVADLTHPDDRVATQQQYEKLSKGLVDKVTFEKRYLRKDGSDFWGETSVSTLKDANGKVTLYVGNAVDISDRKRAEIALRKESDKNQALLHNASDGIHILDTEGNVIEASDSFCAMLGYQRDEIIGMNVSKWDNNLVEAEFTQEIGQMIAQGRRSQIERRHCRKDGTIIDVEIGTLPIELDGKTVLFCSSRDITQRKLIEDQHRRLSAVLRQSNEPVTLVDVDGCYVYANQAFCKLFGYELDELLGKSIRLVIPLEEDSGSTTPQTLVSTNEHGIFHGEVKRRAKDGTIIPLLLNVSPFQNEQGEQVGYVATMTDLTEIKRIENQLRDNAVFSQTILNSISEGIHGLDSEGKIIFENPASITLFGWDLNEMIGQSAHKTIHHTRADGSPYPQNECHIYATLHDGVSRHIQDEVFWRKDGTSFPVDYTSTALKNAAGEIFGTLVSFRDVSEQKRVEENLLITASVFDTTQDAVVISDENNNIIKINPAFTKITGYSSDEVIGKNPKLLSSGRQSKNFYAKMWESLNRDRTWRGEIWNRRKSGEVYAELLSISAICNSDGEVIRYVGVFSDITKLKEHEAELSHVAHFDALTGIPNRILLADRMKQAISQTSREQNMMAICYLDLDGFKPINDTLGHDSGDQVLIEVARRIESAIRGGDTVARLGGDEFVVLLLGQEEGGECVSTLERLLAAIAQPIFVKDKSTRISASIGVSIYPLDDEDPDILLRHADQAMYVAKQAGKSRFHIYDPSLDRRTRDQNDFLKSIRHALEHDQFELHYQPKVNLRTKELVGAEALIRWRHPERGLLSPAEFLRYIDNTDLDIAVGEWVIATSLAQMNQWRSSGLDIEVSINISGYHMESLGFVDKLRQQLTQYPDLLSGKLQIEVLETVALKDITVVRGIIETCREIGVGFALDDFGTGYSSLSYLSSLPVDTLKIDQSFVRDMLEDKGDMAIVQGIIALARAFDRQTVAEGIETEEHYKVLLDMGCELGQGYFIARPMPANQIPNWRMNSK